jgi:hypothetical protein
MEITNMAEARRVLELTLGDYSNIRGEYWANLYDAVWEYMTTKKTVATFQNVAKNAMGDSFPSTGDLAWTDGGGTLPLDEDADLFVAAAQAAELGYIEKTADRLRLLKKSKEFDATHEAFAVADGYAKTLDRLYASIKTMAAGSKMLTFVGDDGANTCSDCAKYKNKRHRAKWWVEHNAIPPNRDFECGGYKCNHVLVDDNGNLWSI